MNEARPQKDGERTLSALRREHRALEETMRVMEAQPSPHQLQIARVRQRQRALRQQLLALENRFAPDLMA